MEEEKEKPNPKASDSQSISSSLTLSIEMNSIYVAHFTTNQLRKEKPLVPGR
jgi:hypothetical protein